jgi:hypothetical protein
MSGSCPPPKAAVIVENAVSVTAHTARLSALGLALRCPRLCSGGPSEALDREEMAEWIVPLREASQVRLEPGHIPLG